MSPSIPVGWRLDESTRPELHRVLLAAYGEVGQREEPRGSNRGPRVDMYTGLVGAPASRPGFRWCVAFVRWLYTSCDLAFPRTWSVSELIDWGAASHQLVKVPLPGDVFAIERPRRNGHEEEHHAGLVVANLGDGRVCSIEGNHGDQVAATIRAIADLTTFVRILPAS